MGWLGTKTCRITCMICMTLGFFLVEIVVGQIANSLALLADSFHMLSDVVALIVGLLSVRFARRGRSKNNTYGWARAEVVGAMVNAVFLIALCFTIFVEAIERLIMREPIDDAYLLLYVGGIGLAINLIGLCMFHNHAHGHTHGGSSHTHSHSHSHSHKKQQKTKSIVAEEEECTKLNEEVCDHSHHEKTDLCNGKVSIDVEHSKHGNSEEPHYEKKEKDQAVLAQQLNMRAVFLHVLGDALGSVIVMISAALTIITREFMNHCHEHIHQNQITEVYIEAENHTHQHLPQNMTQVIVTEAPICEYTDPQWVQCIDPVLSLLLIAIILSTSLPLLKHTAFILMQTVPTHVEILEIQEDLEQMEGIQGVHDLHIWSLAGNRVIASLHIHTTTLEDYVSVSKKIKKYFHDKDIHSVTIQPEFLDHHDVMDGRECCLECGPDLHCHEHTCCGSKSEKKDDTLMRKRQIPPKGCGKNDMSV